MKFWQYFKINFKMTLKQWPALLLGFILTPLILSFVMSVSMDGLFNIEPKAMELSIYLDNQDQSPLGQGLNQVFDQLDQEQLLQLTDRDKASYEVKIPHDFSQYLVEQNEGGQIQIVTKDQESILEAAMLEQMVTALVSQYQEALQIQKVVLEAGGNEHDARSLMSQVQAAVGQIQYQSNLVDKSQAPTSRQYYAIISISFILVMILSSVVVASVKPELQGVNKRISLLPLSHVQRVMFDFMTNLFTFILIVVIYMGVWKLIDAATFAGNVWTYLLVTGLMLALMLALSSVLNLYMNEKRAGFVSSLVSLVWAIGSGMLPLNKMSNQPIFEWLATNPVKTYTTDPLLLIMQGQSLKPYYLIFAIEICLIIACLAYTIYILGKREVHA